MTPSNPTVFQEWTSAWLQAVVKAWTDPAFKARLLRDPRDALADFGYQLPQAIELQVLDFSEQHSFDEATKAANFDPSTFAGSGGAKLAIPLLPAPKDLADGLVTLARPAPPTMLDCVCVCY